MSKVLINFVLKEDESKRFLDIFSRIKLNPGKPPTKADLVKALMGFDYFNLLDGSEREYLSGRLESLPELQQGKRRHGKFVDDRPRKSG
jgi:hypothetical protein